MKHKLALIGFGTVGQGLCEILINKKSELKENHDFDWEVVAVSDLLKGSVYCPDGLNVYQLLDLVKSDRSLEEYECKYEKAPCKFGWDAITTIHDSNADIVCELSYTDVKTGEPALTHCKTAFENGKHVVTSNKGPAALKHKELKKLAEKYRVQFFIEGTVMSGTPILNLARGPLAGCSISAVRGILNGTTNYILTEMEAGKSYEDVLKTAQKLGYAEADPTGDVEGYDAMAKVIILANVVMGADISAESVDCEGITGITPEMINEAKQNNARWKLIGSVEKSNGKITARVKPEMIPLDHFLAGVMGATNALIFSTDLLGDVTIVGAGAGRAETGFSILSDILSINDLQKRN